jgi:hypothetical protein
MFVNQIPTQGGNIANQVLDFNPKATDKQLKLVSHVALAFFAIFSASFATALNVS